MRVALVSLGSADDVAYWSGIPFHVKATLTAMGVEVCDISPLRIPQAALRYRAARVARRLGRDARYDLDRGAIRSFGEEAHRRLRDADADAVVATSVLPLAGPPTGLPTAVWSDATLRNLTDTYREFGSLSARRLRNGRDAERRGLAAADVLAYASPWAAGSAVATAGADPAKLLIAPFGSGLDPVGPFDVTTTLAARPTSPVRLLWIGADWERKRGDLCVAIAEELRRRGVDVRLTMVGARPPAGRPLPPEVEHLGFVDKGAPDGRARLSAVLQRSHLLLLPSRAECFGIAIAEAAAHAVPALAARVGGIPGAIDDGRSGLLLDADATAGDYADRIVRLLGAPEAYRRLAMGAHDAWAERLNWTASCTAVLERLGVG